MRKTARAKRLRRRIAGIPWNYAGKREPTRPLGPVGPRATRPQTASPASIPDASPDIRRSERDRIEATSYYTSGPASSPYISIDRVPARRIPVR